MKMHKLLLLALACTWSVGALAQWQWIDKDGRKVFSDRPPPQDIPDSKVLKQPRFTPTLPAAPAKAASAAQAPASTPASAAAGSGKDKELEKKKAQAEADEAAKQKAAEAKQAVARADNCNRAKEAKAVFESGKPVRKADAQGELVFLDEAGRAAEMRRIQSIIDADCKR